MHNVLFDYFSGEGGVENVTLPCLGALRIDHTRELHQHTVDHVQLISVDFVPFIHCGVITWPTDEVIFPIEAIDYIRLLAAGVPKAELR